MPNNMISLSPLSTQNLVLFHLEDFFDTMGDVIEGRNLNIGPSRAESPPSYALRNLFLEQHPLDT